MKAISKGRQVLKYNCNKYRMFYTHVFPIGELNAETRYTYSTFVRYILIPIWDIQRFYPCNLCLIFYFFFFCIISCDLKIEDYIATTNVIKVFFDLPKLLLVVSTASGVFKIWSYRRENNNFFEWIYFFLTLNFFVNTFILSNCLRMSRILAAKSPVSSCKVRTTNFIKSKSFKVSIIMSQKWNICY